MSTLNNDPEPLKCKEENCNFFGSEEFGGYCSKCGTAHGYVRSVTPITVTTPSPASSKKRKSDSEDEGNSTRLDVLSINRDVSEISDSSSTVPVEVASPEGKKRKRNRCDVCNKKVGLLGFECRCDGMFCALHRLDKDHDCKFDYKTLQRSELAKNNPKIIGEKVKKL